MSVEKAATGIERDGREIMLFDVTGPTGLKMRLTNYGGIIVKLLVPDRDGQLIDVVLGFDEMEDYFTRSPYFGALIGRYANRIDGASFTLGDTEYHLTGEKKGYSIHGGANGFSSRTFDWEITGDSAVRLAYVSADGEEGYPGTLFLTADYELTGDNALKLTYTMQTDRDTVVNITNHSYFNLSGAGRGDVLDHVVQIDSEAVTEVDDRGVPTGTILAVEETPLDFRIPHPVGERIGDEFVQLRQLGGYDHNYLVGTEEFFASAWSPKTGIRMDVKTTMPAVQFYSGCNIHPLENAKDGASYDKFSGLCFETQYYPDSPHHPQFPSTVLHEGEKKEQVTEYRFSVQDSPVG